MQQQSPGRTFSVLVCYFYGVKLSEDYGQVFRGKHLGRWKRSGKEHEMQQVFLTGGIPFLTAVFLLVKRTAHLLSCDSTICVF